MYFWSLARFFLTKHHWKPPEIDFQAPPEKIWLDPPKTDQSNTGKTSGVMTGCFPGSLKVGLFHIHLFLWCFFLDSRASFGSPNGGEKPWPYGFSHLRAPKALRSFGKALLFGSLAFFTPQECRGMPPEWNPWPPKKAGLGTDAGDYLYIYIYV